MDNKMPQEQYETIKDAIYKATKHIKLEQKRPLWTIHIDKTTLKTDY